MARLALLMVVLVVGVVTATGASGRVAGPPPGASAVCRDATYSYSASRSGTCSHHGGVAQWLTQSAAGAAPTAVWAGDVGATRLLQPRTRQSGCKLGPNPDRRCSPGAYYTGLTRAVLCSSTFRTSDVRHVTESEKFAVEREYGLAPGHYGSTLEIDHIVSLELGGSNDIANLFPERANAGPGYHVKDVLENRLHAMVCSGAIQLAAAQTGIAANWQALYKRVFGTAAA